MFLTVTGAASQGCPNFSPENLWEVLASVIYRLQMIEIQQTGEFESWLDGLPDRRARFKIAQRITRISNGLLGDVRPVGGGVSEARINYGPGYRLYFHQRGSALIVLLCGGDKGSQDRDIARARDLMAALE